MLLDYSEQPRNAKFASPKYQRSLKKKNIKNNKRNKKSYKKAKRR